MTPLVYGNGQYKTFVNKEYAVTGANKYQWLVCHEYNPFVGDALLMTLLFW